MSRANEAVSPFVKTQTRIFETEARNLISRKTRNKKHWKASNNESLKKNLVEPFQFQIGPSWETRSLFSIRTKRASNLEWNFLQSKKLWRRQEYRKAPTANIP